MPSLPEQTKIAGALSDVDELIQSLDRLIEKKRSIRLGVMYQLLTGTRRLPGFRGPWTRVLLGEHVSYAKTVALSRAQLDSESPVRYLHYGDIHKRAKIRLDSAHERMPRAALDLIGKADRLRVGDLVFADASEDQEGVGKALEIVSVPEAGVVAGLHTIAARFDKTVLADGFKGYIQFIPSFRRALIRLAAGTKVLAITRSIISSIELALPGIREQQAIAEALLDMDAEIDALIARREKTVMVKQAMMQELLTGKTRLV